MMKAFRVFWRAFCVIAALGYAYEGLLYIGAFFTLNDAPMPPLWIQGVAFIGVAILMIEATLCSFTYFISKCRT